MMTLWEWMKTLHTAPVAPRQLGQFNGFEESTADVLAGLKSFTFAEVWPAWEKAAKTGPFLTDRDPGDEA